MGGASSTPKEIAPAPLSPLCRSQTSLSQDSSCSNSRKDNGNIYTGQNSSCSNDSDENHGMDEEGYGGGDGNEEGGGDRVANVEIVDNSFFALKKLADLNQVRELKKKFSLQDTLVAPSRELDAVAMVEIGMAIRENKTITSIDLPHQHIQKNGLLFLLQELYINTTLTSMDLSYNEMGTAASTDDQSSYDELSFSEACTAMAKILTSNVTIIDTLNLNNNHLSPDDGTIIGQALATNETLKTLHLNSNGISNPGALSIGSSISSNRTLLFLDLSNNQIGPGGVTALASALRSPTTALKTLCLERNNLGAEGCKSLANGLKDNSSLKTIR